MARNRRHVSSEGHQVAQVQVEPVQTGQNEASRLEQRAWELYRASLDAQAQPTKKPECIAAKCFELAEVFEQVAESWRNRPDEPAANPADTEEKPADSKKGHSTEKPDGEQQTDQQAQ